MLAKGEDLTVEGMQVRHVLQSWLLLLLLEALQFLQLCLQSEGVGGHDGLPGLSLLGVFF